jgi:hypothetical protein
MKEALRFHEGFFLQEGILLVPVHDFETHGVYHKLIQNA